MLKESLLGILFALLLYLKLENMLLKNIIQIDKKI